MKISVLPFGVPFKFDDCEVLFKKILPFDDFPCVCCIEEISDERLQIHIYEDFDVMPVYAIQQSLF